MRVYVVSEQIYHEGVVGVVADPQDAVRLAVDSMRELDRFKGPACVVAGRLVDDGGTPLVVVTVEVHGRQTNRGYFDLDPYEVENCERSDRE